MSLVRAGHAHLLGTGGDPFAGFTRLSSLLAGRTAGQALAIGATGKLLVDVQMQDSDRLGHIAVATGGIVRFDPGAATRLLADGVYSTGDFQAGALGSPHPTDLVIDLCGPIPTTNGYTSGERTALDAARAGVGQAALGSALARGQTHIGNTAIGNDGLKNDAVAVAGVGNVAGAMRGLINAQGGVMRLYGQVGSQPRRLAAHYASGTTLVLDAAVTAKAGDEVWITPSGFWNAARRTEKRILAADVNNSATITITAALGYARWGLLQYRTDTGISLTPDTWTLMNFAAPSGSGAGATYVNSGGTKPRFDSRQEIDERAWVVIRNRNIKLRSYDVTAYNTSLASSGFGIHTMSMDIASWFELNNCQIDDYGQLGLLGRYGAHSHVPAYVLATGALQTNPFSGLTDGAFVDRQYRIERCTFGDGHNRALNNHGSINTQLYDNATLNSVGNSYHEEDGSEEPDTQRNVLIGAQDPGSMRLKAHESADTTAGQWFASQRGTRKDNWTVDCQYLGWVNSFPFGGIYNTPADALAAYQGSPTTTSGCLGLSSKVPRWPYWDKQGTWDGNSALCCGLRGGFARTATLNNAGDQAYEIKFQSTTDGKPGGVFDTNAVPTLIKNARHLKCGSQWDQNFGIGGGGYFNSPATADYDGWVSADNYETHFEGRTGPIPYGKSHNHIIVRESLNHEGHVLAGRAVKGFATYHGTLEFFNLSADGFQGGPVTLVQTHYNQLERNSVIETWESYTDPVMTYSNRMGAWAMTNCAGSWHTPSHAVTEFSTKYDTYTGTSGPPGQKFQNFDVSSYHLTWQFGQLYDHFGLQGAGPTTPPLPFTHIVFNEPFYTAGGLLANMSTLEENAESVRTTTPIIGFSFNNQTSSSNKDTAGTLLQRVDDSFVAIAGAIQRCEAGGDGGAWSPQFFPIMKNWCAPTGAHVRCVARYKLDGSVETFPGYYYLDIWKIGQAYNPNASATDFLDLAVPWPSATGISGVTTTSGGVSFTAVASWAALKAATVNSFWKNGTDNEVWARIFPPNNIYPDNPGSGVCRLIFGTLPPGTS